MFKRIKTKIAKNREIKTIMKKSGWDKKTVEEQLEVAKTMGMKRKRYLYNEGWKYSIEELEKLNKDIETIMRKQKYELAALKGRSKVLKEEIVGRKLRANKVDISDKEYYDNKLFLLSNKKFDELLLEKQQLLKRIDNVEEYGIKRVTYKRKHLEKLSENEFSRYMKALKSIANTKEKCNEFYIKLAMERTGLSREKAINDMDSALKMGIDYKWYIRKGAYGLNKNERQELAKFLEEDDKRRKERSKEFFNRICEVTGLPSQIVELKAKEAKAISGCSYEDYLGFKFWEISPEEQTKYITLGKYDLFRAKYDEYFSTRDNFDVKANFNVVFKDFIKRVWFTNENLSFKEFEEKIKGIKKLIIKPLASTCGIGITTVDCNKSKDDNKKIYDYIMGLDKSIVEEFIIQNKEINEFCKTSVNTIRVTTLYDKGKCTFLPAIFRMGNGGVVDNFHADGLAASIDLETGIVNSNGVDLNNNIFEKSPATGKVIKGFKIPYWDLIKKTCEELAKVVPNSRLIGWDIAVTDKGIDLIEGNNGAYFVSQLVNVENRIGCMPMIEDFIKDDIDI